MTPAQRGDESADHSSDDTAQQSPANAPLTNSTNSPDEIGPAVVTELSDKPVLLTVEARAHGWRIDHYLGRLFPSYSRSLLQKAIAANSVLVNGLPVKASRRLRVNDCLSVRLPELPDNTIPPEDIPLDILFEDDAFVVINKPAGLIVHPGRGRYTGTLTGALQFHFDSLSDIAGLHRPGIVHRLDRDTSGVIVVAKDNQVHAKLSRQFEQRTVKKQYVALIRGGPEFDSDTITTHVRVHRRVREKMQVCPPGDNAREAVTFYEIEERFRGYSLIRLYPKTGRTHQLRVHMLHLGHPILADRLYAGRTDFRLSDLDRDATGEADRILLERQALHAHRLEIDHPVTGERCIFEAPLPADMTATLTEISGHCAIG